MTIASHPLPLSESVTPTTIDELIAAVADAAARGAAIYPIGGGTSLDFGLLPRRPGVGIILTQLNRVVDYPARDLTITVEAGISMRQLADVLAAEGQWLPVDVPQPERATLGGVIATNSNGPRRFGHGTIRDYVIGIHAVAADGRPFKAGGRVVKNVAGYDFCKLLTGSLGTLAIVTQVTLKVKPRPASSRVILDRVDRWDECESRLSQLNTSATTPTAIEVFRGQAWSSVESLAPMFQRDEPPAAALGVLLEGSELEVNWMLQQLRDEWQAAGVTDNLVLNEAATSELLRRWAEFPAADQPALVLKASVLPSSVAEFMRQAERFHPAVEMLAHAADGVVLLKYAEVPSGGLAQLVVKQLNPLAKASAGHVVVLQSASDSELTRQAVWGSGGEAYAIMSEIKRAWDPEDRLNPGRFIYV